MSNAPTLKLNARYYRALPIDNPGMDTILGWNIQLYHSDYRYTPSCDPAERSRKKRLGWHIASPLRRYDIAATVLDMGCNLFVNKPPQHQGIQPHPRALQTQVQAVNKQ